MDFTREFRQTFDQLCRWRRDVRRFRTDPLPEGAIERLIDGLGSAPSVGLSEPWRFVRVESAEKRRLALSNFEAANRAALAGYDGERAQLYTRLKLSGMREAPEQLAVFCNEADPKSDGLGQETMPEMRRYSVVCAIMQLWLAARALGIGLGWVSILDPERLIRDLGLSPDWRLVAYLCIGYAEEDHLDCELERAGWETREGTSGRLLTV